MTPPQLDPPDATPLVQPQWLADNLGHPGLVVLDTRGRILLPGDERPATKAAEFAADHVPGATFVAFDRDFVDHGAPVANTLAGPERFAARAGELGIGDDDLVVAYDDDHTMFAARLWWAFRAYGHDRVRVLDGGYEAWVVEGHPVSASFEPRPPATFTARPRPELRVSEEEVAELVEAGPTGSLGTGEAWLVDARSPARFRGEGSDAVGGHVPGARNLYYGSLLDPATGRFLPREELREVVRGSGLDPDAPPHRLVATCGSGVSASVALLGLELAGVRATSGDGAVYDDSWAGWSRSGRAVASGPEAWG
jgi:thiosulfate/3-mercaptopyruvate sulfurtransferase